MGGVDRIIAWLPVGLLAAVSLVWGSAAGGAAEPLGEKGGEDMGLIITSPAFAHMGKIPKEHTCEGDDLSPNLSWRGLPPGTRSLALIVDDPDAPDPAAPKVVWVHWVVYNIPPRAAGLPAAAGDGNLPKGTLEGRNDWKESGYRGPCPPVGRHRYFFKLYALDTLLPDLHNPGKARLSQAMAGHVLDSAELVGTYQKSR